MAERSRLRVSEGPEDQSERPGEMAGAARRAITGEDRSAAAGDAFLDTLLCLTPWYESDRRDGPTGPLVDRRDAWRKSRANCHQGDPAPP